MRRRWSIVLAVVLSAMLAASAGSSFGSRVGSSAPAGSSAGSACGKQLLTRVKGLGKPSKMYVPSEPINMKALKGKKFAFIAASLRFPLVVHLADGFKLAAKYAGVEPLVIDGQASVTGYNAAIQNAINAGADVIILDGQDPNVIGSSLALAQAKNIPVVSFAAYATPYTKAPEDPIKIYLGLGLTTIGKQMADYAMSLKGCTGSYELLTSDISLTLKALTAAAQAELAKECHGCDVHVTQIASSQVNTLAPQAARIAIQNDPNVAIIAPDIYLLPVIPTVQSLGSAAKGVIAVGYEGDVPNLDFVRQGTIQVADDSYPPLGYPGFLLLDTAARSLLGKTPAKPIRVPDQFITTATFAKTKNPYAGFGNFTKAFLKVWGAGR